MLFSYADRGRVNPGRHQIQLAPGNGGRIGTVLIDGTYQANWRITIGRDSDSATLLIRPLAPLTTAHRDALTGEGAQLLKFAAGPVSDHDIRFA